jgi:hypothetical protein
LIISLIDWLISNVFSFMQKWAGCVQVPIFYYLTQMEILFDLERFSRQSWPNKWMWILEMLQNCPKLQHLIIHDEVSHIIISFISLYLYFV